MIESMEAYRTPDERFVGLPGYTFAPRYLAQGGLRMHYVEEEVRRPGAAPPRRADVGVPLPEADPAARRRARVVAPDYFGFGRSDKPTRIEDYSYDFHYASIERLADELDLRGTTVVVQDWGGPIGLRLAVEHPERVARLVILNTGIGAGPRAFSEWLRFREFMRRVGTRSCPASSSACPACSELADEVVEAYNAPFPTPGVEGRRARLPGARADRARATRRRRRCSRCAPRSSAGRSRRSSSSPTRTRSSRPRPPSAWRRASPGAGPAEIVAGAGHFLQEDKGEEIAERIVRFLDES